MQLKSIFVSETPQQWNELITRKPWLIEDTTESHIELELEQIENIFNSVKDIFLYEQDEPGKDQWGRIVIKDKILGSNQVIAGDCDDFAVEILERIYKLTNNNEDISLLICINNNGEKHMVATYSQFDTTWVFDNNLSKVMEITAPIFKNYKLIKMNIKNDWFLPYIG